MECESKKVCFRSIPEQEIKISARAKELIIDICLEQIKVIGADIEFAGNAIMYRSDDLNSKLYGEAVKRYRELKNKKREIIEVLNELTGEKTNERR